MENSTNAAPKHEQILKEILTSLDRDGATEFHLPPEVVSLDKAALLAVIYRLLPLIR